MSSTDDEGLRWDGDEAEPQPVPRVASAPTPAATDDAPAPTSSILLVTYGILGGVFALYTVGWVLAANRNLVDMPSLTGEILFQFGEFLAIAAAPVWFVSALVFTRGARPIARLTWLLAGAALLAPWPFILGGTP